MSRFLREGESIPLRCTLCPKTPQFSDISHLLTHISSKGHLSHKFKLGIRAQSETQARRQLEEFEIWYADNGLDELLAERLASKEQKNTTKRVRNAPKAAPKPKPRGRQREWAKQYDPVKLEYDVEEAPATPTYNGQAPRMHMWNTRPVAINSPFESEPSSRWEEKDAYATPTMRRSLPNFARNENSEGDSLTQLSTSTSPLKSDVQDDSVSDNSKLKGIYWPGMNLFDSATTEMKRMRNQKKDGSILAQMKKTSKTVVPNEIIYNTQGEFQRVKDMYETSPECSPTKSERAPSPKKRRAPVRKTKAPLAEISSNVPRNTARNTRNKGQVYTQQPARTKEEIRRLNEYKPAAPSRPNPLATFGMAKFMRHTEEDDELALTLNNMGKRKPMAVFRDEEAPSPGRTESPLEERRYARDDPFVRPPQMSANGTANRFDYHHPLDAPISNRLAHKTPPAMQKPGYLRYGDKENAQPEYLTQRATGNENAFPPQAFQNHNNTNPLFYHSYGYAYGFSESPAFHGENKLSQSPYHGEYRPSAAVYDGVFRPIGASVPYQGQGEFKPPQPNFSGEYKTALPAFSGDFKPTVMPSPFRDSNERTPLQQYNNEHSNYNSNPFTFNMGWNHSDR